ncbi:MAG: hypothetical protein CVV49_06210 [Spirochaetae bacterium HGW-Spirochaetae-5]|nr:MAG: hypothetical protein CVV49_06210 [Spirochaetae bacterium HGW-Spirochaetae-5]
MAIVKGVKIGPYSINLSLTGFVVTDRTSKRHMTVCYNIFRNAIDVHVKCDETRNKIIGKLFPIPDVMKYIDTVPLKIENGIEQLRKSIFRVTPKWLVKHNYSIIRYSEVDLKDILKSGVFVIKRKYNFDKVSIQKNIKRWHLKKDYSPFSLLRTNKAEAAIVQAFKYGSVSSRHRLLLINVNNEKEWYAIRFSKIERIFEKIIDPVIAERVEKSLDEVFAEFNVDGLSDEVSEMMVFK